VNQAAGPSVRRSIPANARERTVSPYRREGAGVWLREVECRVGGEVVGRRSYDEADRLIIETPLKNGKKHGRELTWDEDGDLELIEPHHNGKIHGTARQYYRGRLIGTYALKHGTGLDIWRSVNDVESPYVAEIHRWKQGLLHGYDWWLNEDEVSVWREAHYVDGELHGIEREWNERERLRRGYPRYWVNGQRVNKRQYLAAARRDPTLPPFSERDQSPQRQFPPEVRAAMKPP